MSGSTNPLTHQVVDYAHFSRIHLFARVPVSVVGDMDWASKALYLALRVIPADPMEFYQAVEPRMFDTRENYSVYIPWGGGWVLGIYSLDRDYIFFTKPVGLSGRAVSVVTFKDVPFSRRDLAAYLESNGFGSLNKTFSKYVDQKTELVHPEIVSVLGL